MNRNIDIPAVVRNNPAFKGKVEQQKLEAYKLKRERADVMKAKADEKRRKRAEKLRKVLPPVDDGDQDA